MNDIILLKMNLLGGMDDYVRNVIGDDDITDFWNIYGVPDECDEQILREIAEDDNSFRDICKALANVLAMVEDED